MKPPVRWKDSEGGDPIARQLLRAGERTRPLPAASRQRGARHAAALTLVPFVGVGLWSKGVVAAFGVGFAGALTLVSVSPEVRALLVPSEATAPARSLVPARAPTSKAAPIASAPVVPAVVPERPPSERSSAAVRREPARRSATPVPVPVPVDGAPPAPVANEPSRAGIAAELELLLAARRRLANDASGALALLDRHRAEFPHGALAKERDVLAVEALSRMGQREAAREQANTLLEDSETGFYADRLEQLLSSPP